VHGLEAKVGSPPKAERPDNDDGVFERPMNLLRYSSALPNRTMAMGAHA
jgi:hypothetical protein